MRQRFFYLTWATKICYNPQKSWRHKFMKINVHSIPVPHSVNTSLSSFQLSYVTPVRKQYCSRSVKHAVELGLNIFWRLYTENDYESVILNSSINWTCYPHSFRNPVRRFVCILLQYIDIFALAIFCVHDTKRKYFFETKSKLEKHFHIGHR